MRRWFTDGADETRRLGAQLAAELVPDGVMLLDGDLGAGKTVLVQGLAAALGIDAAEVLSPTFTLVREHSGSKGRLVHIDLYRLEPGEVADVGIEELLASAGVKAVEWAERLPFDVPGAMRLELLRTDREGRREVREMAGRASSPSPDG